jgi:hypothetical protein
MNLYDRVKIKKNGKTGIIVDIANLENGCIYTIEDDEENTTDDKNRWALYECKRNEIELITPLKK